MDNALRASEPDTDLDRVAIALAEACRKVGADLRDDAAFAGLRAAALAFTGAFKGYLADSAVDQETYKLVVATAAALLGAGESLSRR